MSGKLEVTEAMVIAVYDAGHKSAVFAGRPERAAIIRLVTEVLKLVPASFERERYDLRIRDARLGDVRARFLYAAADRCYFQIETEHGKVMRVHANDIYPHILDKPRGTK